MYYKVVSTIPYLYVDDKRNFNFICTVMVIMCRVKPSQKYPEYLCQKPVKKTDWQSDFLSLSAISENTHTHLSVKC